MEYRHEIIKTSSNILAWIYLHSENRITFVPKHWHRSLEITLIINGNHRYNINGRPRTQKEKDLLIINSGSVHSYEAPETENADALSIIFPYTFLKRIYPEIERTSFSTNKISGEQLETLKKLFWDIFEVFKDRKSIPFFEMKLNSTLYLILFNLFSNFRDTNLPQSVFKSEKYMDRCKKLIAYVDDHYTEPITLLSLAKGYGMSQEHLARIFKAHMGTTFKKYLTSLRLYNAHSRLIDTDLTEMRIALDCGFPDTRSFINCFKEKYGITPNKYRKTVEYDGFDQSRPVSMLLATN